MKWILTLTLVLSIAGLGELAESSNSIADLARPNLSGRMSESASSPEDEKQTELSPEEKLYGLSLFWKEASYNFAYFDHVPDLNWDKTYQEFIPKVLATRSLFEYYRVLQRFCALLKDGHTNVYMPQQLWNYFDVPQLQISEVQHRAIVRNVGESLQLEIPIGSEIIEVSGVPAQTYLEREVFPYISSSTAHILWSTGVWQLLEGVPNTSVAIKIRTPEGQVREVKVIRNSRAANQGWAKPDRRQTQRPLLQFKWLEGKIAYVALNSFGDEKVVSEFKRTLTDLYECEGLILDLRANGGGNTDIAKEVLDYLTDRPLTGAAWRTREHRAAFKAWGSLASQNSEYRKYLPYFEGTAWYSEKADVLVPSKQKKIRVPIVILTGYFTGSAAEDFLIYLDKAKNVTRLGQPTFGSTGQPLSFQLPGGGKARICTKRDTYPDGRDFVGKGVQPDIQIDPSIEDLINTRDVALEKGIALLKGKIRKK